MEELNILVSISCIAYNHEPYIRQCLDGFLMQKTNFGFEVLVHDDCSTDGTDLIIKEYAERYPEIIKPLFENENQYQNGKPSGTFVWNAPRAKGKYIAFCEGDDCWIDPYKLQKQVSFLESHPDYVLSHSDYNAKDTLTGKVKYSIHKRLHNLCTTNKDYGDKLYDYIVLGKYSAITLTVVARKDLLIHVRETEPFFKKKGWKMGDTPMWAGLSKYGKFHYLHEATAEYNILSESASHSTNFSRVIDFYANCIRMVEVLSEERQNKEKLINEGKQNYINQIVRISYLDKNKYHDEIQNKIIEGSRISDWRTKLLWNTFKYPFVIRLIFYHCVLINIKLRSTLKFLR